MASLVELLEKGATIVKRDSKYWRARVLTDGGMVLESDLRNARWEVIGAMQADVNDILATDWVEVESDPTTNNTMKTNENTTDGGGR